MPTETNVYSRNLKVISILFIVYWFVGAHPKDNEIILGTLRVTVEHPDRLEYVSWFLLAYFAWRFFIHSRNKVKESYKKYFQRFLAQRKSHFWKAVISKHAAKDFKNNGGFERFRQANKGSFFDSITPADCELRLPSLEALNTPRTVSYTYIVSIPATTEGKPSRVEGISVNFKFNIVWKTVMHIHVFSMWLLSSEDSADFFIPWALCFLAILTLLISGDAQPLA